MDIKGVITGDIVNSTKIDIEWRKHLVDSTQQIADELSILSPLKIEFFRGDSFQMVVDKPEEALKIAVLLRAGLKSKTPLESKTIWDARIALGVGEISYTADKVIISDGEAFHFSGWEFDEIGKRRLAIRTKWNDINNELKVSTAFADEIITDWTATQARIVYSALLCQKSQKYIATKYHTTAQNISKLLATAKESLISIYMKRYSTLIINILKK